MFADPNSRGIKQERYFMCQSPRQPYPIPVDIDELLDRTTRLLNRIMASLEDYVDQHEQDLTEAETCKIIHSIAFASLVAQRILRAKQLQPQKEETLHDYLSQVFTADNTLKSK